MQQRHDHSEPTDEAEPRARWWSSLRVRNNLKSARSILLDVLPLGLLLAGTQFLLLGKPFESPSQLGAGVVLTLLGLYLFVRGLELALFPLGEGLAEGFARKGNLWWLLAFAFFIGFGATVAEPALLATAHKAELASGGHLDAWSFRLTVAFGVGSALMLGVLRLLLGHPLHWYLVGGYLAAMALAALSPPELVGLSFDSGGITTSCVTVPLIAALGGGLAINLRGRDPLLDGFGMIALASLLPILFVNIYGLIALRGVSIEATAPLVDFAPAVHAGASALLLGLAGTLADLAPIALVIVVFQGLVLRRRFPGGRRLGLGVIWTVIGLFLFMEGLELCIFPLGQGIARDLVREAGSGWLIGFGFLLGVATTVAEPALIAISMKAEGLSVGSVRALPLRLTVALGVGTGIALGVARIQSGHSLSLCLVIGYLLVVLLVPLVPRQMLPLAFDSGGVTTSTVTVPLVVALGLALAAEVPGRHPLVDGFGLIAFASLFPILTVMGYAVLAKRVPAHQAAARERTSR